MKALFQIGYGRPDRVLEWRDIEMPVPEPDQVVVRVLATSINSGDWRVVKADPFIARLMSGLRRPKDPRIGGDAGGIVQSVGSNVTHVKPGDEVFGARGGAFADYVSGKMFVPKPSGMTFEQAAAIPVAATTALQALRDKAGVRSGQRVLVNGAGGGVGHFAVQIAKALGAHVTAVTSTDKLEMVRSLGVDRVIDYRHDDFTRADDKYDAIIDVGGDHSLGALRRALTPNGTIVSVGAHKRVLNKIIVGTIRRRLLRQNVVFFLAKITREDLVTLKEMAEAGLLRPVIDRTYTASQLPEAIEYASQQRVAGKVVVKVASA